MIFPVCAPDSPAGKKRRQLYFMSHLDICSRRRIRHFAIYSFVWAKFGTLSGLPFLASFYSFLELVC